MKLKKEKFGRTDCRVSELCLSTSNFARYATQDESFAILDAFREAGGNFVQTSGICPGVNLGDGLLGMPEEVLGRWLKQRRIPRDGIVIATRIALTRPIIGGLETYTDLIHRCAEDSIRRIGCRHLDFLVLEWTGAIAPLEETMAACEAVVASGKIRHVIAANFPPGRVNEALTASRSEPRALAGLQTDYSLAVRASFEAGAAKLCADHGLGAIARSPLAGGHLAGRSARSASGAPPARSTSERHATAVAEAIRPALAAVARSRRRPTAQVALAWVLAHPQVSSVLVSVKSVEELRQLLGATRLTLSRDVIAQLTAQSVRSNRHALAS